jgi:UDP-N-acetylglucosamine/UDP-N-acetylgalactosamine 4-epimerase
MYSSNYHQADLSNRSILVTGGAGFIGSHLVEYLMKKGARLVRVVDNLSTGNIKNISAYLNDSSFEFLKSDIRDLSQVNEAMDGIDYVLHQAALGSVPRSINDPITTNDVNVNGFLNVLHAAKEAGVQRMVYAASSSTYGDHPALPKIENQIGAPLSPYAVSKYVNELYASVFSRTYGFHTMGLRYFNVFGPRQDPNGPYAAVIPLFIKAALLQNPPTINGDGETSRDFTFVENVVQANMRALTAPISKHEVVNVAFGQRTTLNELWNTITAKLDVDLKPEYVAERKGDVKHSLASIEKATRIMGYHPEIDITNGLDATIEWYRDAVVGNAALSQS